jgi:hypothetical protein
MNAMRADQQVIAIKECNVMQIEVRVCTFRNSFVISVIYKDIVG